MEPQTDSAPEQDQEVQPAAVNSNARSGAKRGRKAADIRQHFTAVDGTYSERAKRSAHRCKSCGHVIPASAATHRNLTDHMLHKCKEVDPAVQHGIRCSLTQNTKLTLSQQQAAAEHLLRFAITSGVPFEALGNAHLIEALQVLCPGYAPPSPTTAHEVLLVREYARCMSQLHTLLNTDTIINLTVSVHRCTTQMGRPILVMLVLLPDGTPRVLEARDVSGDTYTAPFIAECIMGCLNRFGIVGKVVLLVTDDSPLMALARHMVVTAEGFQHILDSRCSVDSMALTLTSILAHPYAKELLVKAQKVVTYIQASGEPLAKLNAIADVLGTSQPLCAATKACITSVNACLESLLANRDAFASLTRRYGDTIKSAAVRGVLEDAEVWAGWQQLQALLHPMSAALAALQGRGITLADVTRSLLHLARGIAAALAPLPVAFQAHVFQVVQPSLVQLSAAHWRLALFLDPRFRKAALRQRGNGGSGGGVAVGGGSSGSSSSRAGGNASSSSSSLQDNTLMTQLQTALLSHAQRRGYTASEGLLLLDQLTAYSSSGEPYNQPIAGEGFDVLAWWKGVKGVGNSSVQLLTDLAIPLLSGQPRSADAQHAFTPGWWFSSGGQGCIVRSATGIMVAACDMQYKGEQQQQQHSSVPGLISQQDFLSQLGVPAGTAEGIGSLAAPAEVPAVRATSSAAAAAAGMGAGSSGGPAAGAGHQLSLLVPELWQALESEAAAAAAAATTAAAAGAAGAAVRPEAAAGSALTAPELEGHLDAVWQQLEEGQGQTAGATGQQQAAASGQLPLGCSSWADAVKGAAGDWDLQQDLLDPGYREPVVAAQKAIQAPEEYDPMELVKSWRQQRQQQQQQEQDEQE